MSDSVAVDQIVRRPLRRVCLVSTASGSGKSTTGLALAERKLRRTARRALRKEELWNGNRERWRDVLHPTNSVVVHALRNYCRTRRTLEAELARFRVARLRSPAEVETFLESIVPVS